MSKDSKIVEEAFKYYKDLISYGGNKLKFRAFLWDKCDDPFWVYKKVMLMVSAEEGDVPPPPMDRNEPFKTTEGLPSHLFAKEILKKILGTNRLF